LGAQILVTAKSDETAKKTHRDSILGIKSLETVSNKATYGKVKHQPLSVKSAER
jgi:hypothetical protein